MTKFHFDSTVDSKEINKCNFHYVAIAYDDVTDFEICGFHKKHQNLNALRTNIFSSNKKIINYTSRAIAKNSFAVEVTFKKTEYLKTHELKNIHSIITDD